ncbi:hypothetical protein BU24DRAFT_459705 [Aaosphaeria arxii CBS 175.79]|uniref:BZIP domain-containing protein n=1 Tax=Aaosphaeria arxii CBS 175.79 TaxID=1450172 RepID=A0A6A5Y5H1_9PLEO|nr:uncharacterized protein BU24DRAFT_459705 [Aaosphaeria arxii CBS 175.79]KAF2020091.1 hypothetical protein BU24DRAFT_459705 [Aaosphaeria arxii CBS 175.79]
MSDTKTSKAQNLARIRDNQRRSRARRKEYLHELEAKLRQCEQMGVEASTEIQSAARKVLEENRRLRAMLRTRGVPEIEIVAALGHDKSFENASAATTLMSALERKRTAVTSDPHVSETKPIISSDSTIATQQVSTTLTPISIPSQPASTNTIHETQSPLSVESNNDSPPPFNGAPYYPMEMTSVPHIKTEPQLGYSFDHNSNNPWLFPSEPTYLTDPASYYNTASCIDAANIIRTMGHDIGGELGVDLQYQDHTQGSNVLNPSVYNTMERYTANGQIRM